ncbi:Emc5p KNAG_0H02820 [Huiozyma naganishii CBS 8797]|uniref:ER membrane protein complex subunit 5 n=1 Tax=Huiozyma naganishii (strain ATCC MYA-139 / BCRC 22969 / CBS 8797 / KCTC 17520 / NBRC 10181 / NCYC 3082 / Yp74L-3) TaxID=1071383 RepID=J7S1W7_HUIN7|nr:hypothetical protein KNAG_0H02820 [Kazachstania naganishii CBS 8797]CCK71697.1 hypothetical protein KNAG_0H02820 [Kazachstania naganishii CBS 8797]
MGFISRLVYFVSVLLLLHAAFSSFEYHQLMKNAAQDTARTPPVPRDIVYETYAALALFITATILSHNKLTYYNLFTLKRVSQDEYLRDTALRRATTVDNMIGNDPAAEVTHTPNLADIMSKRKEVIAYLQAETR